MKRRSGELAGIPMGLAWLVLAAISIPSAARGQSTTLSPTVVTLTFDDTRADQYQALAVLQAHGMNATFFVNSGRIGLPGFMTVDQVLALQDAGNEIGGHTVTHADLPTLDENDQKREVCNDRVQLMSLGFAVTSFAYPYGDTDPQIEELVQGCGYNSARGIGNIGCSGCRNAESVPPIDVLHTSTPDSIKVDTALAEMEGYVSQAQSDGGGWVQIVMHYVCDGCNRYSISLSNLTSFLDFIADAGVTVATVQQVIDGSLLPPIPGPPPPDFAGGGTNLLTNPSLEATDGGIPTCWSRGGEGTFDAGWMATSNAYDGTSAQRLDLFAIDGGASRLYSGVVTGYNSTCPLPPVLPGHSYSVKAHYIATTAHPFFSIYAATTSSLMSAKPWQFYQPGDALPLTATYAVGSLFIPPLDGGIVSLSVGLSLKDVGELSMDAFSLEEGDTIPPTVALLAPSDGTTVSGIMQLVASAADSSTGNSGIALVDFLIDGVDAGVVVTPGSSGVFNSQWDSRTMPHTSNVVAVSAVAWDNAGNSATASISVTINNNEHVDDGGIDAGALDAGVLDAGPLDAGVLDAGPLDAGVLESEAPSGCGCSAHSEGMPGPLALLTMGLFVATRRRSRRSATASR